MTDELETAAPATDAPVDAPAAPEAGVDAPTVEPAAAEAGAKPLSRRDVIKANFEKLEAGGEPTDKTPIEKQRDAAGRFKPGGGKDAKPPAAAPPKNGAQAPQQPPAVQPPKPGAAEPAKPPKSALKAPQSWSEIQRKDWDGLPETVKKTITQREAQIAKGIQDYTQRWKPIQEFGTQFTQMVTPFKALMEQEASTRGETYNPLKTIGSLLQTAAALRSPDMRTRVSVAASILNTYGLNTKENISLLADALEGKGVQPGAASAPPNQPPQPVIDPQALVRQAKEEFWKELATRQDEQLYAEESSHVAEFRDTHEHFDAVRQRMADLMEMSARRMNELPPDQRVALDFEVAYRMACLSDPEIAPVYQQAEAAAAQAAEAEKAKANTPPAQRVPGPPSSIRSRPGGVTQPPTAAPKSRREVIAANYAKLHEQQ